MGDWFVGEIRDFSFNRVVPSGWLPCDGRTLPINQNAALFSLLGTTYGGDGRVTFALPDLRGRVAVGRNPAKNDYLLGKQGGVEKVSLTAAQLPTHNHNVAARQETGTTGTIAGNYISSAGPNPPNIPTAPMIYASPTSPGALVPLNPGSLTNTGGGAGHENMQPFAVTNFCIATNGVFPPRQ